MKKIFVGFEYGFGATLGIITGVVLAEKVLKMATTQKQTAEEE